MPSSASADMDVDVTEPKIDTGHYELEITTALKSIQGTFNPYGEYYSFPDGTQAWNWLTTLGGSYRFNPYFEASASVPIRQSSMNFPTGSINSTSIGGALVGGKLHLGGWPHLVLHAGISTPFRYSSTTTTGDPSASAPADFGDSYTSGLSFPVGMGVSHAFGRFRFAIDASYTIMMASEDNLSDAPPGTPPVSVQPGNRFKFTEGMSFNIDSHWYLNAGSQQMISGDTYADGVDIPGTAGGVMSMSFGATYSPNPTWRYTASVQTLLPYYVLDANQSYGPGISLSISFLGM